MFIDVTNECSVGPHLFIVSSISALTHPHLLSDVELDATWFEVAVNPALNCFVQVIQSAKNVFI